MKIITVVCMYTEQIKKDPLKKKKSGFNFYPNLLFVQFGKDYSFI